MPSEPAAAAARGSSPPSLPQSQEVWRKSVSMIVVVRGAGVPRAPDVVGVITKEHIADSVAESVRSYLGSTSRR